VQYGVDEKTSLINYEEIEKLAKENKPKLIFVGATAYPRIFDWQRLGEIADSIGAYLVADISHIAGLVAGGSHPSPVPYVHLVTTTTHKTLRGPRGAMIMVTQKGLDKDPDLAKKVDKAVFPGLQGGPSNLRSYYPAGSIFHGLAFHRQDKLLPSASWLPAEDNLQSRNLPSCR